MAEELGEKEVVSFREARIPRMIQLETVTGLLIEKGIITEEKFFAKLKQIQGDYERGRKS